MHCTSWMWAESTCRPRPQQRDCSSLPLLLQSSRSPQDSSSHHTLPTTSLKWHTGTQRRSCEAFSGSGTHINREREGTRSVLEQKTNLITPFSSYLSGDGVGTAGVLDAFVLCLQSLLLSQTCPPWFSSSSRENKASRQSVYARLQREEKVIYRDRSVN